MTARLLGCLAAAAVLVAGPAASADPLPDPDDVPRWLEVIDPLDDTCVRNYEHLEGDVCSPVDAGSLDRLKTVIKEG